MTEARLQTSLWVQAQVRLCDIRFIPIVVVRRGDPEGGAVMLKRALAGGGYEVLSPVRDADGGRAWMRAIGADPVAGAEADAYIEKQIRFDPDLWVLEIDDPGGAYEPDAPVI